MKGSAWSIERIDSSDKATSEQILDLLIDYNEPYFNGRPPSDILHYAAHDTAGKLIGGLLGEIRVYWLHVSILVTTPEYRKSGLGSALMRQAEAFARAQKCEGIWLDTFAFQAPGFYDKLGFNCCGTIKNFYNGHDRFIYEKHL